MDKNFHDLLVKYINGRCTPAEREKVDRWYGQIEDKDLALAEDEKLSTGARMLAKIRHELSANQVATGRQRLLIMHPVFKVAAAILVLAVAGLWFLKRADVTAEGPVATTKDRPGEMVYVRQSETGALYSLPDGSTVKLEPYGEIHFRKDFSEGRREVYLTGQAFFDIVKDPSRPFYVYSGAIATRVLGTSFFVSAPADAQTVEVKVITGSVSVFQVGERNENENEKHPITGGVVLSPNEKVKYFMEGGHWVTGLVEDPVPVRPIEKETLTLVFENTTLNKVLADISERYGIEVVTENEKIGQCTFTGNVSRMSLFDMLDVISSAVGSSYEVKGTRILMSGKGCD